jgi:hypothetical protein
VVVPTVTAGATPTKTPTKTASSPASTTAGATLPGDETSTSHAAGVIPAGNDDAALGGSLPVTGQLGPARLALIMGSILVLIAVAVFLALTLKRRRENAYAQLQRDADAAHAAGLSVKPSTKYDTGIAPVPSDSPTLTWDRPTRYDTT